MIDLDTCSDYLLLSTAEVAKALRVSQGAVRKLANEGRLRVIDEFRTLHFPAWAVREFIGRDRAKPSRRDAADGHAGC